VYNIKIDFQEMGWGDMEWVDIAQYMDRWRARVSEEMYLRVPLCEEFLDYL